MIYYNAGKTDNPKDYNAKIVSAKVDATLNGYLFGCIGQLACESCGIINSGTCLCAGIFTCCECGFENGNKSKTPIHLNYIQKQDFSPWIESSI